MRYAEKILIIRLSSIGDILLSSPLVRCLRNKFPNSQIDFLVRNDYSDLVKYNPHISKVIEFDIQGGFNSLKKLTRQLKQENYDIVLDIHNSLRSRYIRYFIKPKSVHIVDKRTAARFCLINFKQNLYKKDIPVAERYLETAKKLGVENDKKGLEVFIHDNQQNKIAEKLLQVRSSNIKLIVGVAPSAKHNTKKWQAGKYIELLARLVTEQDALVLAFGGIEDKNEIDGIVNQVNEITGKQAAVNFAGELSLLENAAAFDYCNVVITNDTGLMHIAAARKKKIVALFGPTVREFGFFPYGTENIVVEDKTLSCRPCSHIGSKTCPKKHFKCMQDISSEKVYTEIKHILNIQ
ncbi:MAG: lipopolysaccharide heptosyltransferase II [Bacteroidota bacterium]|nr:lipopolysaccharide heptosyltransferase II [Bacteroidota bacterium]